MLEQDRECWGLLYVRYVSSSRLGSDVQEADEVGQEEEDRLEEDVLVKPWWAPATLGYL